MSLRVATGVVGAGIGFVVGGPQGAMWGWTLGSAVGNVIDPQIIRGPELGDMVAQTSQEGVPIPIGYGTSPPISGNIMCTSPVRIVTSRSGGKGGPKVETQAAFRTYAIEVCEGPIGGFIRVWRNNVKVYDALDPVFQFGVDYSDVFGDDAVLESRNELFLQKARFFLGTYDQNASTDLEAIFGVGTTPAHRGIAYMVIVDEDVTDMRGAIPQWTVQVSETAEDPPVVDPSSTVIRAFGGVTVGTGTVVSTSLDGGVTWEDEVITDMTLGAVAYSPTLDRLVGLQVSSNTCWYSDDHGATWTSYANNSLAQIIWSPTFNRFIGFVSAASSGTTGVAMRGSTTGTSTWFNLTNNFNNRQAPVTLLDNGTAVVVQGVSFTFYTADGSSVTRMAHDLASVSGWVGSAAMIAAMPGFGLVGVDSNGAVYSTSPLAGDGDWQASASVMTDTGSSVSVAYGPGVGVTSGPSGGQVSVNGTTWSTAGTTVAMTSGGPGSIAWLPTQSKFAAVGPLNATPSTGVIAMSADGRNWSQVHSRTQTNYTAIFGFEE